VLCPDWRYCRYYVEREGLYKRTKSLSWNSLMSEMWTWYLPNSGHKRHASANLQGKDLRRYLSTRYTRAGRGIELITVINLLYNKVIYISRRSQWTRGLRRGSTAARLLRLWVRIPPGAWMSVLTVVCWQVEVSTTGWSLVQRSPTDCDASLCVI